MGTKTANKTCTKCNETKPLTEFRSRGGSQKHLYKSKCNKCLYFEHRYWIDNNPDKVQGYREKDSWTLAKRCHRRGITPEELIDVYQRQEECCAICKIHITLENSAIDHNHTTDEFRGVLCKKCNRGLGLFNDNPDILQNAADYLNMFGYYGK